MSTNDSGPYRQTRCMHGWVNGDQCAECVVRAERDAAQDMVGRLRVDLEDMYAAREVFDAALHKTDLENERLRSDRDCEKRLRKDAEDRREELSEEIDRLNLENDRLRWSLRQIAGAGIDWSQEKQQIARDALDHVPEAGKKVGA